MSMPQEKYKYDSTIEYIQLSFEKKITIMTEAL